MEPIGRKLLRHETPSWVDPDAGEYFITICCKQRGGNQLRQHESAQEKFEYIRQNPVRVGLVDDPAKWPYRLVMDD